MDIKKKFISFISEIRENPGGRTPDNETSGSDWTEADLQLKPKVPIRSQDPRVDQEAIDSINDLYFQDDSMDIVEYELKRLPEKLELKKIDEERRVFAVQLQSVSRKVSELVLENHPAYATELERVMELQRALGSATEICQQGRRCLYDAKQGFTSASLTLLANYRKRLQLLALLKSLRTIKTLQRTDIRLRELLEEEDYPRAIQLCLECQKAASTYRHYTCISELSSKLQDTLVMIEESMDVALSKTCSNFDERYYASLQTAYRLLGKTQSAVDQLQMHYTSSVLNTAFTKVLGYVELCAGETGTGKTGGFQKRPYADLCKFIKSEVFLPCLIDLCKALWEVMKSYHKTLLWHERNDTGSAHDDADDDGAQAQYIQKKFEHGLQRIWVDVQQKVKTYISSTDLCAFKYDDFIQVLDIVNRLIRVGEEFCKSTTRSDILDDSVRRQSVNYFRQYHRTRLDELRMFLENEGWEICPVKPGFNVLMLQEFKFLRHQSTTAQAGFKLPNGRTTPANGPATVAAEGSRHKITEEGVSLFERYCNAVGEAESPFDFTPEDDEKEDVMDINGYTAGRRRIDVADTNDTDSDEDVPDELKRDFVDEQTGEVPVQRSVPTSVIRRRSCRSIGLQAPILANTTLTVCRLFGKYMQMMQVLKSISFDVTISMTQLLDYYLYAVYSFFSAEVDGPTVDQNISGKLRSTLKRIKENLIVDEEQLMLQQQQQLEGAESAAGSIPTAASPVEDKRDRVAQPHLSPAVELNNSNGLYGLASRIVATQSLIFLAEQLKLIRTQLEEAIPTAKHAFLQQFYSQTLSTVPDIHRPVYLSVATPSVNTDKCLQLMAAVRWDVKDIMSQHSTYVDVLLNELHVFDGRLNEVGKYIPIPLSVRHALWEHVIRLANACFVEGFSSAKKCTNEGRALMQLDYQQFLIKLEKLTDLRPIPGREYVETYVKAYYLPEAQLESWVHEHKEYSCKQLLSLINCLGHIGKKCRQKLITIIEDMERLRK